MERLEKILVCVKRPDQDHWLLGYAGTICRAANSRELHLLHVHAPQTPDSPSSLRGQPMEWTVDRLRAIAVEQFQGHCPERLVCNTVSGAAMVEILRYAMDKSIDLIVLGCRGGGKAAPHEAALAGRVTRKATCSVLVVPENAGARIDRILVPVRNSDCSARAVEVACAVAAVTGGTVCCLNVFPIRGDHLEADLTLEEHMALMQQWAERENQQLLGIVNTSGVQAATRCEPDIHGRPAQAILDDIERQSADLVVIGARGRTGAAGVLLGAVTEQLICQSPVPVLAVKKKGECIGILQALLTLTG